MKKFLSMVMAAAMVVSLVPATAFAASDNVKATAKVVDAANFPVDGVVNTKTLAEQGEKPEVQLTFTTVDLAKDGIDATFTFTLDNATIDEDAVITAEVRDAGKEVEGDTLTVTPKYVDEDEFEISVKGTGLDRGMVLAVELGDVTMDKVSKGKTATISVDSDDATVTNGDDLVFASVESKEIGRAHV